MSVVLDRAIVSFEFSITKFETLGYGLLRLVRPDLTASPDNYGLDEFARVAHSFLSEGITDSGESIYLAPLRSVVPAGGEFSFRGQNMRNVVRTFSLAAGDRRRVGVCLSESLVERARDDAGNMDMQGAPIPVPTHLLTVKAQVWGFSGTSGIVRETADRETESLWSEFCELTGCDFVNPEKDRRFSVRVFSDAALFQNSIAAMGTLAF